MTYETDIADKITQKIGYYFKFEGLATVLSTHDFNNDITCVDYESISQITNSLDRQNSFIEPSGCSFDAFDNPDLRNLINIKGGTEGTLSGDITSSSSLFLTSLSTLTIGQLIYLNKETVKIDSSYSAGGYGILRAQEGSIAASHNAESVISTQPRHILNRNCKLYAVDLDTQNQKVIGSFFVSSSPSFRDGIWNFQLADLLSKLNTPIFTGWQSEEPIAIIDGGVILGYTENYSNSVTLSFNSTRNIVLNNDDTAKIKVKFGKYWGVFELLTTSSLSASSIIIHFSHVSAHNFGDDFNKGKFKKRLIKSSSVECNLILEYRGTVSNLAKSLLVSKFGGKTNSDYDVFAGTAEETGTGDIDSAEKRIGAGIQQSLVDLDSFDNASSESISVYLDEETRVIDFFSREILWRSGGYLYLNSDGKIAFKKYKPHSIRSLANAVTQNEMLEATVNSVFDEQNRIAKAVFECNYIPENRLFTKKIEVIFSADAAIYGDNRAEINIKSKGIWIGATQAGVTNIAISDYFRIQTHLERLRIRQEINSHRMSLRFPWRYHLTFKIGEVLKITDARLPTHEDVDSLEDAFFEVIGVDLDIVNGEFTAQLEKVEAGVLISPSCEVSTYNAGTLTVTIDSAGDLGSGILYDSNAGDNYPLGCKIVTYRASASPPFSTFETNETAAGTTLDEIVLRNTPSINPAAGDIIVIENGDDTLNLNDVGADVQDFAFGADSNLEVGTGSYLRSGPKWG